MTTRHRTTLSIRATLLATAAAVTVYVGVIGMWAVLNLGESAAAAVGVWALVGLVLLIGMTLVIHRRLYTPFAALDEGLARVARGDLETSLPVQREDELGRLTSQFNQMTEGLRGRASDAQLQTAQLAERFGRIFEHSFNDIYVFDSRTLGLLQMNQGALSKLGYEAGQVESLSVLDLLEGYDEAGFRRLARPLERDEQPGILFSATHVRNNGTTYPVDITLQLWKMEEPAVFVAIAQDVAERRRGEMIRVAAQRIAEIALTAPTIEDMFYQIHSVVGELMPARNFYLALYDAISDTINFPYYVDEEDAEVPLPKKPGRGCTEYVLRSGQPLLLTDETFQELAARGEVVLLGPRSADWLGVPLVADGKVIGVLVVQSYGSSPRHSEADLGILQFVSTQVGMAVMRRQAERAIADRRHQLQGILDAAPFGAHYYELRPDGALVFTGANRSADQILHADHSLLAGRDVKEAFPGLASTDVPAIFRRTAADGVPFDLDRLDYDAGGIRGAFEVHAIQTAPRHLAVFFRDITDRIHLEEQVRHAQKMESIGRLAGGVAHDFNNLLTVMLGFAAQAKESLSSHDPARADLEEVEEAGAKAASLTRQLLAFARRQVTEPRLLDLNAVTFGMDKMLRRLIGEDIQLVTRLGGQIWTVLADIGQIEQVIVNLAVNARDAMPRGGTLTIETANASLDIGAANEDADMPPGQYVLLTVDDTGQGMSVDVQEHIFEPFFTTKEMGRGTGLGLATCYGIVKQAGGWIWVSSHLGRGTTFRIYLPRVDAAPETISPSETIERLDGSERVLLVEDEDSVRRVAARVLRQRGYDVTEASDGREALELVNRATDPFDLVLTDVVMPIMGGQELAERLLARGAPVPKILFASGYTEDGIVRQGVLDRNTAFLAKPYTLVALTRKVRATLDGC
ncbi:MAG: ATP-binding protein [Acidobacteria bacterium]|nr:ATP-binding protein [Acidobacteriota bacterium]